MKTGILFFVYGCLLATSPCTALAQSEPRQLSARACIDLMNGRTAALVAEDWDQLEVLATRTLQGCRDVLPAEAMASANFHLAKAALATGRPRDALASAEACISIFYQETDCHIERLEALLALGRYSEAKKEFQIVDRIVRFEVLTRTVRLSRQR